ncbi:MAG: DUF599 domain-containing protein [Rhizobiales bacterium]|nr:DUF599 domain-containing protein [Hyphomicrobiales bacterium]MBI3672745.1 DUF599 domain-containing protein [Hyphomicrobiales bacterium]
MMTLPDDLGFPQAAAIVLIFALWGLYGPILKLFGKGSLNTQLHAVRKRWLQMHQGIDREHRVFDAILLGHISSSISYFGSATLLVLAGLVGTLINVNRLYIATRDLSFLGAMSAGLFTIYVAVLTLILALSFFAFTYSLRKMAYTFALMGGLQATPADTPESRFLGEQTATVLTEAVRSINTGIRGFYYAVAALFLFAGPYVAIAATLAITGILCYRQMFSPTALAIGRYVEALGRVREPEP